jgi:ribosomal protein S12 methylthiotransferase RimO
VPDPDPASSPTTVAIVTLGCGRNEVDSENAAGLLTASGYRVVADPEQADAVVVNTCAFVEAAKRESIETILDATALKEQGRARTVLVTGCLAERYTEELRAELPEADAIVPFSDYGRLPDLLGGTAAGAGASPAPAATGPALPSLVPAGRRPLPMVFPTPVEAAFPARAPARGPVALVKLAEGCDRDCSFCAIPSFRGRFRSRRPTEVLDEVAWLSGQGVSEVCLVAENSTSYGKDLGGREALIHLLRDLAAVDGLRRVRLNYLQPDELTPGLLEEMAANPVVCSYFDLSLQHASAPVLRRMRRGGSAERFLDLVTRIRALDPDAAFRSNFILGFPGETPADVRELEEFLEAARLDWVAFFAWSPEDGTAALDLDGRVAAATARARVERVQELQDRVLAEAQEAWVGRRLEVLVERVEDGGAVEGRSHREAPESDGVVRVEDTTGQVRRGPGNPRGVPRSVGRGPGNPSGVPRSIGIGEYLPVEVTAAQGPELLARLAG